MNKGKKENNHKKYMTIYVLLTLSIIIIASVCVVKTYLSHANRWNVKSGTLHNNIYTTHSILSQNLQSSEDAANLQTQSNDILNIIEAHNPDIICFQEASNKSVQDLATYFTGNNFDVVIKYADEANTTSTPIFYNSKMYSLLKSGYFWLSDTPNMESVAWEENRPYIVTWALLQDNKSKDTFGVVNVNISKDVTIQTKSLNCIQDKCKTLLDGYEYVICGTFNFTAKDSSYQLISNTYNNLSNNSNKLYNVGPTTTNETETQEDDYVYDYFFGTNKIKCDRYAILRDVVKPTNGLYHYSVMSNIYFNNNN